MNPTPSVRSNATRRADEAAQWVARHDSGLSAGERLEFERWLESDPDCPVAWAEASSAWAQLDRPRTSGQAEAGLRHLAARARGRSRRRLGWIGGVAALTLAAVVAWQDRPVAPGTLAPFVSPVPPPFASTTLQLLPDGSTAELREGAAIAVNYTEGRRGILLLRGEAHFEVVKDPARPFVVDAAGVAVRAVGTAFVVRVDSSEVEVLVTSGVVAVEPPLPDHAKGGVPFGASDTSNVPAGARVVVRLGASEGPQVTQLPPEKVAAETAWRGPRLNFSGTRLADAVAQLNRVNAVKLVIEDPALGEMAVSGLFRANNPDGFARIMELSGLKAEWRGEREIVLRRAP